jgi:phage protein D
MEFNQLYTRPPNFTVALRDDPDKQLSAALDYLRAVTVQQDLTAPSMFTLEIYNWDDTLGGVTWSDDELFAPGNEIEISLGYLGRVEKVMVGELTSLEPAFQGGTSTLMVRGYDLRHRLLRGRKTRSFTDSKDSEIVEKIAGEASIKVGATDTKVKLPYVLQHNQTDLAFIRERARRIGYEVYVKEKTLQFQPLQIDKTVDITLTHGLDILEMYPRLTTMSQVGEVVVRGWDVKEKEAIVGTAAVGDETATMNGTSSGPKTANTAFGKTSFAYVDRPVFSKAEADQMALSQFNRAALAYIDGEGLCYGRPDLKAGTVITIEGLGEKFSGLYYITSVKHLWSNRGGYRTRFTYQRNAA